MPPLALLAPLAASALGSTLLPAVAGSSILGIGTGTLGGILGGAAAGALTNEDPLMGALMGGVTGGVGGPGIAEGIGSLAGGVGDALAGAGDLLGVGAEAAATGAPAAAPGFGAFGGTTADLATGAAAEGAGGASALASPELAAPTVGSAGTTTGLESSTAGGAYSTSALDQALSGAGGGTDIGAVGDIALPSPGVTPAAGGAAAGAGAAPTDAAPPDWLARNKDWVIPTAGVVTAGVQQATAGDPTAELTRLAASNSALATSSPQIPAGMQAGIDSAKEAAKARMRSMFAQRGMAGSSSEAVALANIEQTAAKHGAELAQGMISRGLQANQMNAGLYAAILQQSLKDDQEMSNAIGRLTQSLAA